MPTLKTAFNKGYLLFARKMISKSCGVFVVCFFIFFPWISFSQVQRPNIIFILGDDIGYEVPTINGGKSYETPNIDMLATEGALFTQFHATPLCSPSRFMVMTGKYNFRNYRQWGIMDSTQRTFGNMFKDAGYKTAIYGKWQLSGGNSSIHAFGFDNYLVWDALGDGESGSRYKNPHLYKDGNYIPDSLIVNKYADDIFTDSLINFIDSNKAGPFFAYYPMCLAHNPSCPTPDDSAFASWDTNNPSDTAYFPSMVKYLDKKIGMIIDKVKSLGIEDNTLIVFTGDNGSPARIFSGFEDIVVQGGKTKTTEFGTRVPLLIYWHGKTIPSIVNNDLIDFTDFLPTLAEITNIPKPVSYGILDGVSFASQIMNATGTPRNWIFCHFDPQTGKNNSLTRWVQNKNYKLYDTTTNNHSFKFYNIVNDIKENFPLKENELTPAEASLKQYFLDVLSSFSTGLPKISNPTISSISSNSAVSHANLIFDSLHKIECNGVAWSYNINPSLLDNHTAHNADNSFIHDSLHDLTEDTTYYLRAYATNDVGTVYSVPVSFKTLALQTPIAKEPANVFDSGFTAKWQLIPGITEYTVDVSESPSFSIPSPATITNGFDSGIITPTGWIYSKGVSTNTTTGKFGMMSPSLQLTKSNQRVTTPLLNNVANQISFWVRGLGTDSLSSLKIEGFNGFTWVKIDNIKNLPTNCGIIKVYNAASNTVLENNFTQFRFTFLKSTGNIVIDDISVNYISANPNFLNGFNGHFANSDTLIVNGIDPSIRYYYRVRAIGKKSFSSNSNVISVITCTNPKIRNIEHENINCNGNSNGFISISMYDSTSVATYNWNGPNGFTSSSQNITSLSQGNYHLTITSNHGCTTDTSIMITEPSPLNISEAHSIVYKQGDSAMVTIMANGGTEPYIGIGNFSQSPGTVLYNVTDSNGCSSTINVTVKEAGALIAIQSHTLIKCHGEKSNVTIEAIGGKGPYTGTGNFIQSAGISTYTVTDANGDTSSAIVNVSEPDSLVSSESHTLINCYNDLSTVYINGTGGTLPYNGTGIFTQKAGNVNYIITDANGCNSNVSAIITQPDSVIATESHSVINCYTDSSIVFINGTGGTAPYIGSGYFKQPPGSFVYNISDSNGCKASVEVTVEETYNIAAPVGVNGAKCGSGSVLIAALPASGEVIDWYTESSNGVILKTNSNDYSTPKLNFTKTYYAESRDTISGCKSTTRTPVIASIDSFPAPPEVINGERCDIGVVTLSAYAGTNETIDWYAVSSGGSLLKGGSTSYTTTSLSTTKQFYVQSRNIFSDCKSTTRTAIIAIVNRAPLPPSALHDIFVCNSGSATISATPGTGETIDWYASPKGGTYLIPASLNFSTPIITTKTTYYAEARNIITNCVSNSRTAVIINVKPTITYNTPINFCQGDSVILTSSSASTYQWKKNGATIVGATSQQITVYSSGSYSISAFDIDGCQSNSNSISVTVNSCAKTFTQFNYKQPNQKSPLEISATPNPAPNEFKLILHGGDKCLPVTIRIVDIYGKIVFLQKMDFKLNYAVGKNLLPGIYLVEVSQGFITKKITVEKFL